MAHMPQKCPDGYEGYIPPTWLDTNGKMDGSGICSYHKMDNCRSQNGRLIPPAVAKYCPDHPCPNGYKGMIKGVSIDIKGKGDGNPNSLICSYHKTETCIKVTLGTPHAYPGQDNSCKCPPTNLPLNCNGNNMEWQKTQQLHTCPGTNKQIICETSICKNNNKKCIWATRNLVPPADSFDASSLRICDRNKAEGKDGSICSKDDACISPEVMKGNPEILALANKNPNAKLTKTFKCDCSYAGNCRLKFNGLISSETNLPICPSENSSTAKAICPTPNSICKKASPESFSAGELKDGWRKIYRCDCF